MAVRVTPHELVGSHADHRHGTVDAWFRVFQTFPLLQVLDINGEPDDSVETVFLGLRAASESVAATQTDTGSPVACPNLQMVTVECKGTVETCFRYRAEKEVVLDTLSLGFAFHAEDVPLDARRAYVKDMRKAVVDYVFRWVRSGSRLIFASESEDSASKTEDPESESDGLGSRVIEWNFDCTYTSLV